MRQRLKWLWSLFSVAKIIIVVTVITFKVASVADISLLVAKIIFAVCEIIIKEDVISS